MADIAERLEQAKQKAEQLKQTIKENKKKVADTTLRKEGADLPAAVAPNLSCRRTLKGHIGKIYAMHWAKDSNTTNLVSAAQDGMLIVWDGISANKLYAVELRCAWVMTCCMAPSSSYIASGGLDNIVTVYNIQNTDSTKPTRELEGHNGHISSVKFINDRQLLSSSGDTTCALWDVESNTLVTQFNDHDGDVLSLSVSPDGNCFVSGSTDKTSKLFDTRTGKIGQMTFTSHTGDINSVQYFPNGQAFGTGSEDFTARLFDIRAGQELIGFKADRSAAVTSVDFSKTGRYLFTAYDDDGTNDRCGAGIVRIWDTLRGGQVSEIKAHKNQHISSIGISGDGRALCTASWDMTLKIFA